MLHNKAYQPLHPQTIPQRQSFPHNSSHETSFKWSIRDIRRQKVKMQKVVLRYDEMKNCISQLLDYIEQLQTNNDSKDAIIQQLQEQLQQAQLTNQHQRSFRAQLAEKQKIQKDKMAKIMRQQFLYYQKERKRWQVDMNHLQEQFKFESEMMKEEMQYRISDMQLKLNAMLVNKASHLAEEGSITREETKIMCQQQTQCFLLFKDSTEEQLAINYNVITTQLPSCQNVFIQKHHVKASRKALGEMNIINNVAQPEMKKSSTKLQPQMKILSQNLYLNLHSQISFLDLLQTRHLLSTKLLSIRETLQRDNRSIPSERKNRQNKEYTSIR